MTGTRFGGLEVISRQPNGKTRPTPLLFIHGAYAAAWCWDEHFLPFFAENGYACHALSVSGHGSSPGRERLDSFGIDHYVRDVAAVAAQLPAPPVLIGHSMGGFVAQKYLERRPQGRPKGGAASLSEPNGGEQSSPPSSGRGVGGRSSEAAGLALLASVPPQGLWAAALGLAFQKPGLMNDLNRLLGGGQVALDTLRTAMFSQPVETADLLRWYKRMQPESHRAIWDMTLFNLPLKSRMNLPPLLVLGGEHDTLIPSSQVEMTARHYGVEAEIFDGMGHGLMLERDWARVAGRLLDWLGGQGL
ncbi:MAG: alpha/beta hydrolase [Rhodocyclales bacterium]|nr:alpha/beta hydrolase [Rhodocyclales bacterium]